MAKQAGYITYMSDVTSSPQARTGLEEHALRATTNALMSRADINFAGLCIVVSKLGGNGPQKSFHAVILSVFS
jgi:hypothetical protein